MKNALSITIIGILVFGQRNVTYGQQLPIKTARTISVETRNGSYMNVDISPDGRTIVFDLLGDFFTLPAEGGDAVQLTRGLAYNRCPVWSPDGKLLAYISDVSGANRLCLMNSDGTGQRALDLSAKEMPTTNTFVETVPAWASDGRSIAANGQLYHLAGGEISLPSSIGSNVQFSGDGQFLYYYEQAHAGTILQRYNRSTGEITQLASLSLCDPLSAERVSQDGLWLAYVTGPDPACNLRLRNLRTGEDRLLADSIECHHRSFKEQFTFTPNSRSILIAYRGRLHRIDIQTGIDRIVPFHAQVNVDLGPYNYNRYPLSNDSFQVRFTRSANASPDGKTLVFTALDQIFIMSIPNGTPHPLVHQMFAQYYPVFSPDGKWIAYVTWSDTNGGYVWRVPVGGGEPERLTSRAGYYVYPTYSSDGMLLATIRDSLPAAEHSSSGSGLGQLEIIDIENKQTRKLADSIPLWNHLAFSRDGTSLLAMTKNNGVYKSMKLMALQLDGEKKQLVATRSDDELVTTGFIGVEEVSISPDNRYIVYEINEDLYLSPLPGLGPTVTVNDKQGLRPFIRFAAGGLDPCWAEGGKILSWAYGHHFYRIDPDKIINMAIQVAKDSAARGLADNGIIHLDVLPDETIDMKIKAGKEYGRGTIALRNVRIISMKGDEVIENGTIVITDGRIAAIGPTTGIVIPTKSRIFDLMGKTVMPGIIDLHDHVHNTLEVFPQQSWRYLANLAYGVTTARDPASSYDGFGYGELLETGQMVGPRLFGVGYAVGEDFLIINSLAEAQETARKRVEMGAIAVKQYRQETRLQRQWVLIACRDWGLNMTNEGDYDLRGELAMMKDGSTGVEHAYDWSNVYPDVTQFIAKSGTWHTPTLQVTTNAGIYFGNLYRQNPDDKLKRFWPKDRYEGMIEPQRFPKDTIEPDFIYAASVEAAILRQGGHIGLGGHGEDPGIGSQWELWAMQMGGLTNLETLKVATISGAEALGLGKDLGSLEQGKIADLIVLNKNPLDDIHNTMLIDYVMKDGILYDGNTLNTIWPVKKQLPEWRYVRKNP